MENEKTEYAVKTYEELDFSDDFMFGKVTKDRELSRDLLECLLQREVGELLEITAQKEFRYTKDGKPIRMDMYNRDNEMVYDSEMMKLNNKSVEFYQLPRRTRFYQSSIDTDHMQKKASYKSLFYEYMQSGSVKNDLTNRIDNAVVEARKREEWKSEYMKERVLFIDAREEGRVEGCEEGDLKRLIGQICRKISKGKDIPAIADDLEEDDVKLIEKICSIAAEFAPDYDTDKIYEEYSRSETADVI